MDRLFHRSDKSSEKKLTRRTRDQRSRTPEPPESSRDSDEAFGLFELWPNVPQGEVSKIQTTFDIVAIHGLGGHPYKTWTDGDNLWLRDFIPKSVPEARVFTFGYNSGVAFKGSASKVDDYARTLLERLTQKRRQYKDTNRPIIFICHSLGGIVFKKALIIAHERDSRYSALSAAVKSVVFMGTPHRGSDLAFWSSILSRVANIPLLGSIRSDLLNDLKPKSDLLGAVCSQFVERAKPLQIFTIYERLKIPGLTELVVDEDSAILHLPNETPLPMEANHITMCKFLTDSSEKYAMVFDCVSELIDNAKNEDQSYLSETRARFMKSLLHFDHTNVLQKIPRPCKGSCQWLSQSNQFNQWRNVSDIRLMWVQGSPGSGKTVMMRYIHSWLVKYLDAPWGKPPIIAFFFCDDKDAGRRTSLALLRSLLFQILYADKQLLRYIEDDTMKSHLDKLNEHSIDSEQLSDVWDSFIEIIKRSRDTSFWIIIDALDELEPWSRKDVIRQFERAIKADINGRMKVLVTDRIEPRTEFQILSPKPVVLTMGNIEVQQDVRYFIREKIEELCDDVPIPTNIRNAIEDEIVSQATGLFLLASLAWANFTSGVSEWSNSVVKRRLLALQKLPASLESYYCGLLRQVPCDFREKARKAFMWVLGGQRKLNVIELQHAVTLNGEHRCWEDLDNDLGYNFQLTFERACGYLLKVESDGYVEFTHQTVKELLTSAPGSSARNIDEEVLKQYRIQPSEMAFELTKICTTLLQFQDFNEENVERSLISPTDMMLKGLSGFEASVIEALEKFPLVAYAARHWHGHVSDFQAEPRIISLFQDHLLSFQANYFRTAAGPWTREERQTTPHAGSELPLEVPPLHYIMQCGDFPEVVLALVSSGEDVNEMAGGQEFTWTALHWAAARGHIKSLMALLSIPRLNINKSITQNDKPIHVALHRWYGGEDISLLLLKDPRIDINSPGKFLQTPLHLALIYPTILKQTIAYLIDHPDIDINAEDERGVTPFQRAFQDRGHEKEVLKMFKNPNVSLSFNQKAGGSPLMLAGMWDWREVEIKLIRRDVTQVFVIHDDGLNHLSRYAFNGLKTKVLWLLDVLKDEGERIRRFAGEGSHHLLHLCAQQDWSDVVAILADEFGLQGLESDHVGRNMLHWAVENGWEYALNDHTQRPQSWLDHQDRDGMTPLHLAASYQRNEIANHLIKEGADYLLQDKRGRTPVHVAAEMGCRPIILFFLQTTTREFKRDKNGCSLLHYLSMWQSQQLIEDYISQKRPIINVLDRTRRSPLHYAAIYGNVGATKALLRYKALVNAKDSNSSTPLHHSIREGFVQTAALLIDYGADIKTLDGFGQTLVQLSLRSQRSEVVYFVLSFVDRPSKSQSMRGSTWQAGRETKKMVCNVDIHGKTALHRACAAHNFQHDLSSKKDVQAHVRALVNFGADVNATDIFGYTPAHAAAIGNNIAAMDELLEFDCDLAVLDRHQCTALDWAVSQEQTRMAELMREVGAKTTPNFGLKLNSYQKPHVVEKVYDMAHWSLAPIDLDYRTGKRTLRVWE